MANNLIKREAYVDQLKDYINTDFVKVYTGIRKSGKTSLMHNIIDELKSMGVNDENIISSHLNQWSIIRLTAMKILGKYYLMDYRFHRTLIEDNP